MIDLDLNEISSHRAINTKIQSVRFISGFLYIVGIGQVRLTQGLNQFCSVQTDKIVNNSGLKVKNIKSIEHNREMRTIQEDGEQGK